MFHSAGARPRPSIPTPWSSTSRPSSPAWPARGGRRTACRCTTPRRRSQPLSRSCRPPSPPRRSAARALPVIERFASEGGGTAVGATSTSAAGRARSAARSITNGSVVIAAITSCTNTSNPSVMVAAGLLAKKAVERGLKTKPWVKASLAPGSKVVTDYLHDAGLDSYLDQLRFNLVGYGCTTCIGNSGPLPAGDLRGDQPRRPRRRRRPQRQPQLRGPDQLRRPRQLPGLAPAGRRLRPGRHDGHRPPERPAGHRHRRAGRSTSRTSGPPSSEIQDSDPEVGPVGDVPAPSTPRSSRATSAGARCRCREGDLYEWDEASTYVKNPPYFTDMGVEPAPVAPIENARVLAVLGDSITTDHISPAGSIKPDSPAGRYLIERGVERGRLQFLRRPARERRGDGPRARSPTSGSATGWPRGPRGAGPATCPTANR